MLEFGDVIADEDETLEESDDDRLDDDAMIEDEDDVILDDEVDDEKGASDTDIEELLALVVFEVDGVKTLSGTDEVL